MKPRPIRAEAEARRETKGEAEAERASRRERKRERDVHTSNESQKCWSSCCALAIIRERATVALHVEIDLHEHANGCRQRRASNTSSTAHSSNIRARLHKTRACDNTGYTYLLSILFCSVVFSHLQPLALEYVSNHSHGQFVGNGYLRFESVSKLYSDIYYIRT